MRGRCSGCGKKRELKKHGNVFACRSCRKGSDPYSTPAWVKLRNEARERDGYACLKRFEISPGRWINTGGCGEVFEGKYLHAAHIVPRADGGVDRLDNVWTACRSCHGSQTSKEDGGFGNPLKLGRVNAQLTAAERAARTEGRKVRSIPAELVRPHEMADE